MLYGTILLKSGYARRPNRHSALGSVWALIQTHNFFVPVMTQWQDILLRLLMLTYQQVYDWLGTVTLLLVVFIFLLQFAD